MRYLTLILLICCFCSGCAQRISAQISAVAEEGYSPKGESFRLTLLPGHPPELSKYQFFLEENVQPALLAMGYTPVHPGTKVDIDVRVYWFSTGPHLVYREPVWDHRPPYRHGFGPYRRNVQRVEEEFHRTLVVEALLNAPLRQEEHREDEEKVRPYPLMSPQQALFYLPAPPARVLWRVVVESRGSLSRVENILNEMTLAALPWLGKSALVRARVQAKDVTELSAPKGP